MARKYQIILTDRHEYEDDKADSTTILYGEMDYDSHERYVIRYAEESGDYQGMVTEVSVSGNTQVTISRLNPVNNAPQLELSVELERRHTCQYDTPYGLMMMGVYGKEMASRMSVFGGTLEFKYDIDIDGNYVSTNTLHITVKEIF